MLSNLEQEEAWLEGWNELDNLIEKNPGCYLLLPGYEEVSLDEAQSWIQEAAYESNKVEFKIEYYKGNKSILFTKVPA